MITPSLFTVAILAMAVITFTVRYIFFTTIIEINLSDKMKIALSFTAPCILTAMLVPIMFQDAVHAEQITNTLFNSYFLGGFCAIIFSFLLKDTLLVILLSMLAFYGLRLVL